jgi:hypothetical protein
MITASLKDQVLIWLCTNLKPEKFSEDKTSNVLDELGIEFDILNPILIQFERLGLIEHLNFRRSHFSLILKLEAHDLLQRGGFCIQAEIFQANIKKLGFEIENLRKQLGPNQLDSLEKISSIAAALFAGLSLLPK